MQQSLNKDQPQQATTDGERRTVVSATDVGEQTAHEVRFLATSPTVTWRRLDDGHSDLSVFAFDGAPLLEGEVLIRSELRMAFPPEHVFERLVANGVSDDACLTPFIRDVRIEERSRDGVVASATHYPLCFGGALATHVTLFIGHHADTSSRTFVLSLRSVQAGSAAPGPGGDGEQSEVVAPSGIVLFPDPASPIDRTCLVVIFHFYGVSRISQDFSAFTGMEPGQYLDLLVAWMNPPAPESVLAANRGALGQIAAQSQSMLVTMREEFGWVPLFRDRGLKVMARSDNPCVVGVKGACTFNGDADQIPKFLGGVDPFTMLCEREEVLERYGPNAAAVRKVLVPLIAASGFTEVTFLWVTHRSVDGTAFIFLKTSPRHPPPPNIAEFLPSCLVARRINPRRILFRFSIALQHRSFPNAAPTEGTAPTLIASIVVALENVISLMRPSAHPMQDTAAAVAEIASRIKGITPGRAAGISGPLNELSLSYLVSHPAIKLSPFDDFELLATGKRKNPLPHPSLLRVVPGSQPLCFSCPADLAAAAAAEQQQQQQQGAELSKRQCQGLAGRSASPQSMRSLFDCLPDAVVVRVFRSLSARDVVALSATCRRMRAIASCRELWGQLLRAEFPDRGPLETGQDVRVAFATSWIVRRNWTSGRFRASSIPQSHTSSVRDLIHLPALGALVTGASDRKVKVWAVKEGAAGAPLTFENVQTLTGPNAGVVTLDYTSFDRRLFAAFRNGTILSWVLRQGTKWDVLGEQQVGLSCDGFLFMHPRIIVWEEAAHVFDEIATKVVATFQGHIKRITCVRPWPAGGENVALSSSLDKTVRMWDMRSGEAMSLATGAFVFKGHSAGVNCIEPFSGYLLATGANDRTIKVWDIRNTANPLSTLSGHVSPVKCLRYKAGHLISGGDDHSIRTWTMSDFRCLQKFEQHSSPITCFEFNDRFLVSGSSDAMVVFHDFLC